MKWKKSKRNSTPEQPPPLVRDGPYDLIRALGDEFDQINKLRRTAKSDFVQRLAIRQFGSMIDAYAFYFQDRARESAEGEGIELSEEERKLLHVGSEFSDDDRLKPAHGNIRKNLLFGIRIFAKVRGVPPFWETLPSEFDVVIPLRNRLTHPKKASDFVVKGPELRSVGLAMEWFQQLASWGSQEERKYIDRVKERISDSFNAQREAMKRARNIPEGEA